MGDWFDEFLGYFGSEGDTANAFAEAGSDISFEDIAGGAEGIFDFGDYGGNAGDSYGGDYQSGGGNPSLNSVMGNSEADQITVGGDYSDGNASNINGKEPKSLWDKASDFVGENKKITDMGIGLIGSMYNSSEKKKEDAKAYERMLEKRAYDEKVQKEKEDRADARRGGGGGGSSAMEMLAAKEAIDQANKAKFSASVTGLRQPVGLINKGKKLTYVGGKPVFTDNGNLT